MPSSLARLPRCTSASSCSVPCAPERGHGGARGERGEPTLPRPTPEPSPPRAVAGDVHFDFRSLSSHFRVFSFPYPLVCSFLSLARTLCLPLPPSFLLLLSSSRGVSAVPPFPVPRAAGVRLRASSPAPLLPGRTSSPLQRRTIVFIVLFPLYAVCVFVFSFLRFFFAK